MENDKKWLNSKRKTLCEHYNFVWNLKNQIIGKIVGTDLVERYVYGSKSHVPDYMIKNGVNYKIVTDHLGSPVQVVNTSTGTIDQEIKYDEFGNIISDTNPGFTLFGFAGCLYDSDTKLCRFGARDYDASIGRWLSKDPILFAGGDTNLYGYVMQDPINWIDPTGTTINDPAGVIPGSVKQSSLYRELHNNKNINLSITLQNFVKVNGEYVYGSFDPANGLISISAFMNRNQNDFVDTTLHELNHAFKFYKGDSDWNQHSNSFLNSFKQPGSGLNACTRD